MKKTGSVFLFFTGKGGVGKTSLACATAVKYADEGKSVLLVSTDPASNLEDVLESPVKDTITPNKTLSSLFTVNINPETSAKEYRERALSPLKGVVSSDEIRKIEEGLSGACTTEIASFDEFSRFITGEGNPQLFDVIIFDTAPTGHTLRLLELPAAWDNFLDNNPNGATCIGPSSALMSSRERYNKVIECLKDAGQTSFYLVARPDRASLKEAARTSAELRGLGLANQKLMINGIFSVTDKSDPVGLQMEKISKKELSEIPEELKNLEIFNFPLLPYNVLGIEKLRSLLDKDLQERIIRQEISKIPSEIHHLDDLTKLVNSLEESGKGLIMTMGKGGVGKTIVAASIATILAKRGHQVLLTTTDPAAHIRDFMNQLDNLPETLTIERIDPKAETRRYTDSVFESKGASLNDEGKKLLLEDLKSPCTEEVAVFHAFSRSINKAKRQFVVIDTAPTGHTLLLLDTTGSYHKEILRKLSTDPSKIKTPLMFLQDKDFSKIILVALPETTPMREAESLQNDLKRAGIVPFAWVINQCLSSVEGLKDPVLKIRAASEIGIINKIKDKLAVRTYAIPYLPKTELLPAILERYFTDGITQERHASIS